MSKGKCAHCPHEGVLTKDHIIPRWIYRYSSLLGLRGFHNLGQKNIQYLCSECNGKKGGNINVEHPISRAFWTALRDEINKQLRGVKKPREQFPVGTKMQKTGGDYTFRGEVRTVFTKKNGVKRYVCENTDGLLFIFNEGGMELRE